jgi:hypothetical protein
MIYKKQLKKKLKSMMNNFADKCKNGKLSAKSLGIIIRTVHMCAPTSFLISILFGSYLLSTITILFLFGVLICFYTFDSCFLSILEQKLCNDDFVIIDPALELCEWEINTYNRYYISNIIGIAYIITICIIYYTRFYMN